MNEGARPKQDQHQALALLWKDRRTELYRQCCRLLGGHQADAEDALGRVFTKLLTIDEALHDIENVEAWLSLVTRNACLDMLRVRKRRGEHSLELDNEGASLGVPLSAAARDDPERHFLGRELREIASNLVHALPAELRVPLLLRLEGDKSYKDIAAQLALSEESLRKRVQAARTAIADGIGRYLAGDQALPYTPGEAEAISLDAEQSAVEPPIIPACRALYPILVTTRSDAKLWVWLTLDAPPAAYTPERHRRDARYVEEHPSGWKVRLRLADMLLCVGKLDEAALHYRAVLARRGRLWQARWRLAICLQAAARTAEAADVLASMRAESFAPPATREHLGGLIELAFGRLDAAKSAFSTAAEFEPDNGAHTTALGVLEAHTGRPAEAFQTLECALAASPHDVLALVQAYDVGRLLGRTREADGLLERAFANHPTCAAVLVRVIEERQRRGDVGGETGAWVQNLLHACPALAETHASSARWQRARDRRHDTRRVFHPSEPTPPNDDIGWLSRLREAKVAWMLENTKDAAEMACALVPELMSTRTCTVPAAAWSVGASSGAGHSVGPA
jgi:RNA polymerase sigma factor (sigma-70 family)